MDIFYNSLNKNVETLKTIFNGVEDIVYRDFYVGETHMCIVYVDNIVLGPSIEDFILTNLMTRGHVKGNNSKLALTTIGSRDLKEIKTFQEAYDGILVGETVLFCEGSAVATQISTRGWPSRGIPQVQNEVTIQGAKDAFVELISMNIVLVRRRIRDTALKVKRMKVGRRSKTDIALMYIDGIVRDEILEKVIEDIEKIDIDAILDSGYIEQLSESSHLSPFPQMQMTERPDKTAAAIYEGRIAIIVDNTPFSILIPSTMNVFFQSPDDYYERWEIMSFTRLLRFLAAFIATVLPSLYIALTVFNPNLIPTAMALKIAAGRADVPFPTIVEVLIMETAFELLREAGIRIPSPIGGTIGIVGGIVIGQAAVDAGIVGPSVVIISALTGIAGFAVPNVTFVSGIRIAKVFLIIISSLFGVIGFWMGLIFITVHLCSLESFGIPYLFPFCSGSLNNYTDFKDSIIRAPLVFMKKRPIFASLNQQHRKRGVKKK